MKPNHEYLQKSNEGLIALIRDPEQILTLDANFLIPFDRSSYIRNAIAIPFSNFKTWWLDPLFFSFPYLAIHEAVRDEVLNGSSKAFMDQKIQQQQLIVLCDSALTEFEQSTRQVIESKIAPNTRYDPVIDNKDDRGEVKSLSHIATKHLIYFCSHDSGALRLVDCAAELETNLDAIGAIKTFELIYYLYQTDNRNRKALRGLYRYLYFASPSDKQENLSWADFISRMDELYADYFREAID